MVNIDITEPGPDEQEDPQVDRHQAPEPDPNRDITPTEIRLLIDQWVDEQTNANATKALIAHGVMQIITSITAGEVTAKYMGGRNPRVLMIRRHPDF